jgi:hypothetical protein
MNFINLLFPDPDLYYLKYVLLLLMKIQLFKIFISYIFVTNNNYVLTNLLFFIVKN